MDEVDCEEDGSGPDRFRETLGLVPLVFGLLTTHDLPALRCLPPCAATTHLVRREDDDFLRVARRSRSEAREEAVLCMWEEAAARDG